MALLAQSLLGCGAFDKVDATLVQKNVSILSAVCAILQQGNKDLPDVCCLDTSEENKGLVSWRSGGFTGYLTAGSNYWSDMPGITYIYIYIYKMINSFFSFRMFLGNKGKRGVM